MNSEEERLMKRTLMTYEEWKQMNQRDFPYIILKFSKKEFGSLYESLWEELNKQRGL